MMRRLEGTSRRERKKRRALEADPKADRWMISYADLVTLLLAVFVVLYMSSEMERGEQAAASLRAGFITRADTSGLDRVVEPAVAPAADADVSLPRRATLTGSTGGETPPATPDPTPSTPDEMTRVRSQVETFVSLAGLERRVRTRLERRGLVVSLIEAGFFEPGSATPRDEALPVLDSLGRLLAATPHHIRVEGHTDDTPIRTARFPSNWELSTARATWLVAHLASVLGLPPQRLSAAGYGEFRPIAANETASGRARNRRVDIVLLTADASTSEPLPAGAE